MITLALQDYNKRPPWRNDMEYEKERSEGIACNQTHCHYWDFSFDQFCAAEKGNGDPVPAYCEMYNPETSLEE